MKLNFFPVIVIYNSKIEDSSSYKSIKNLNFLNISIIDNSTDLHIKSENRTIAELLPINYFDMQGNVGLSKAYNRFLDSSIATEKNDIVIWLDDDSHLTKKYFSELEETMNNDVEIAAPIMMGQDGKIWSPNNDNFIKNKQLKNVNEKVKYSKFNAINSCTAVRASVYSNYRYDERLYLDQVDHLFFFDQRKLKRKFHQMNIVIQHNFSLKEKNRNFDSIKRRYTVMIPDFINYAKIRGAFLPLIYLKIFGWGIREMLELKNPKIFMWIMKRAFNVQSNLRGQ